GDRRRWLRPRVPRARPGTGAGRRDEGAAPRPHRGPRSGGAVPARGAAGGAVAAPQHSRHLRHHGGRGLAGVRDGARPRPQPRPAGAATGTALGGPDEPPGRRGAVGPGARPRPRSRAPRPQAREHADRARRPTSDHGLRARPGAARRGALRRRDVAQRNAAVRGAGAAPGRAGGPARGPVLARRRGLLRLARLGSLPGGDAGGGPRPPDDRRGSRPARDTPRGAQGARDGAAPGRAERPGGPLSERPGVPGGAPQLGWITAAAAHAAARDLRPTGGYTQGPSSGVSHAPTRPALRVGFYLR